MNFQLGGLKAAWTRKLNEEAKNILWRRGFKVKPFQVTLMIGQKRLGLWRPAYREIMINEDLIATKPWTVVLGILTHELAHLLTDDIKGTGLKAHGQEFLEMAKLLNLDPIFQKPSLNIKNIDTIGQETEEDIKIKNLMMKVQKLLALSHSSNQNEAEAAISAAFKLMAKHNLENIPQIALETYSRRVIALNLIKLTERVRIISNILSKHFLVEIIFVPIYNQFKNREEKYLEIYGLPENTLLAEHIFYFLIERTETLWQQYRSNFDQKMTLQARRSFIKGLLNGFQEQLKEIKIEQKIQVQLQALAPINDPNLSKFIKQHHPKIRLIRSKATNECINSLNAGHKLGLKLKINTPVEQNKNLKQLLITS